MDEALRLLDEMATSANVRTMFTSEQVLNLLLDIRNALTFVTAETEAEPALAGVS